MGDENGDRQDPLPTIEVVGVSDLSTTWIGDAADPDSVALRAHGPHREGPRRPRYLVLEAIGRGAMGTVHRAKDQDLRRIVAFKTVNDPSRTDVARRLLTEVQVTAQLDHPSVVPVYGLEQSPEGGPAYAMKYVQGRTLSEVLAEARRQWVEQGCCDRAHDLPARLDIFLRICDALAYAHSKGVVHRDLKPTNVMVGPFGEVYVMDWGIARVLGQEELETLAPDPGSDDGDTDPDIRTGGGTGSSAGPGSITGPGLELTGSDHHTRVGHIFGTPAYMAPEQARGESDRISPRSDIYSLGLILYELVVLSPAYRSQAGRGALGQAQAAQKDPPEPPPGCPRPSRDLLAVIERATQADPARRYPTVRDLADEVGAFLRGEATTALPDRPPRRIGRWLGHHPRSMAGMLTATVALAVLAVVAVWSVQQQRLADQALVAEHRENRVTSFQREVDARGQRIDREFLWVEGRLDGLSAAAEYAFTRGTPTSRPTFSAADYADPARAPAGLVPSVAYGKPVSPELAVYTVAPGVPERTWQPDLAMADGLLGHLRGMFLAAPPGSPGRGAISEPDWIATRGNPVVWAYVAIERSGLMYMFPGAQGWDEHYDPRTRPWYRVTLGKEGNVWGTPYVDLMGQGRLLSATRLMSMRDHSLLGVAGIDLQFEQVVDRLVAADDLPGYRTAYLVDSAARVMVESAAKDRSFAVPATLDLDQGIDFGRARRPEVRAAAQAGTSGQAVVLEGQEPRLLAWSPLSSVGWTYVVEADLAEWLAAGGSSVAPSPAHAPG